MSEERKLKKISTDDIEKVISKAITKLSGSEYKVDVTSIDFMPNKSDFMSDNYEIKINVNRIIKHEDLPF